MADHSRQVFLTGGTGYMGRRLTRILLDRGHYVKVLTRITPNLGRTLPMGCHPVFGSALAEDYFSHVAPSDTFVHLVGVSHPSPAKAAEFRTVDLKGLQAAVKVAQAAHIRHFVYVSVAHPAPMMKAYIAVREECEQIIRESGLNATILRPWYVLGPGHRWPYVLLPMYWIMERFPNTRASALRLGLVTLEQMLNALVNSVENPCEGTKILEVPQIRKQVLNPVAQESTQGRATTT